ncbi:DoxX family protein [Flavitalea sp.]|nr:DoxX family protein [Flavitalea sp.]
MKRSKLLYWIFTILFAGFMIWSGIPGIEPSKQSVDFLNGYLGYPIYFIQFISLAKVVGGITILIPGFAKAKEWAYAGLFFDLTGAIYSIIAVAKKVDPGVAFILLPILLGVLSYVFWKKLAPKNPELRQTTMA